MRRERTGKTWEHRAQDPSSRWQRLQPAAGKRCGSSSHPAPDQTQFRVPVFSGFLNGLEPAAAAQHESFQGDSCGFFRPLGLH